MTDSDGPVTVDLEEWYSPATRAVLATIPPDGSAVSYYELKRLVAHEIGDVNFNKIIYNLLHRKVGLLEKVGTDIRFIRPVKIINMPEQRTPLQRAIISPVDRMPTADEFADAILQALRKAIPTPAPASSDASMKDVKWLAGYLDVPVGTLYQWRHIGYGPPSLKIGRHLRYRKRDVDAWLDKQQRDI